MARLLLLPFLFLVFCLVVCLVLGVWAALTVLTNWVRRNFL